MIDGIDQLDQTPGGREQVFEEVAWTEAWALRAAGVDRALSREQQVEQLRDAIDDDRLPDEPVDALIEACWSKLGD